MKATAEQSKQRRLRRANKRRAYLSDRILRGKLTARMKRHTVRAALFEAKRLEAERLTLENAAAAAEIDRLAAERETEGGTETINSKGEPIAAAL